LRRPVARKVWASISGCREEINNVVA
jgi:hypothetical protein